MTDATSTDRRSTIICMVYSKDREELAEMTKGQLAAPGTVIMLLLWPSKPDQVRTIGEQLRNARACLFLVDREALASAPAMDAMRKAVEQNISIGVILPEDTPSAALPEFARHLSRFPVVDAARTKESLAKLAKLVLASRKYRGPLEPDAVEQAKARSAPIVLREPPAEDQLSRTQVVTVRDLLAGRKASDKVTLDPQFRPFVRDRIKAYLERLSDRAREIEREGEIFSKAERAGRYVAPILLAGAGYAAWKYRAELAEWWRGLSGAGLSEGMAGAAGAKRSKPRRRRKEDSTIAHVFGPAKVKPGEEFNLTVSIALVDPASMKPTGDLRADPMPLLLRRNDRVRVEIHPRGLMVNQDDVDRHERGKKWKGDGLQFGFEVVIPEEVARQAVLPQVLIHVNGEQRTEAALKIECVQNALREPDAAVAVMGEGKTYDHIFVSYSRMDRPVVWRRVQSLKRRCRTIFFDEESLQIAGEWKPEIANSIRKASLFALFWSESASQSEWVNKELDCAWQLQGDSERPILLPHSIGRFNWREFRYVWPFIPERLKELHFEKIRLWF